MNITSIFVSLNTNIYVFPIKYCLYFFAASCIFRIIWALVTFTSIHKKIGKHFASLRIAAGCLFCRSNWTSKTIAYDIIPILDVILQMCTVSRGLSYRYNCNCTAMTRPQVPLSCSVHSPALSIYNNNMRNFYFCQYVIFTTKPPASPADGSVKQRKDEYIVKA